MCNVSVCLSAWFTGGEGGCRSAGSFPGVPGSCLPHEGRSFVWWLLKNASWGERSWVWGSRGSPQPDAASLFRVTLRWRAGAFPPVQLIQAGAEVEAEACGCCGCRQGLISSHRVPTGIRRMDRGGAGLLPALERALSLAKACCSCTAWSALKLLVRQAAFVFTLPDPLLQPGSWASCHLDLRAICLLLFLF